MTENRLKQGLAQGRRMAGFWLSLDTPAITEMAAHSGIDWLLVDMEHSPTPLSGIGDHLRAAAGAPVETLVRVPQAEPVMVKRLLDLGARSLMFPMIESAEQARQVVGWTRYPPHGIRGISATTRANNYGRDAEYLRRHVADLCVIVQVETPAAVAAIPQIAAVEGVDAVFVGPGDLAAAMGHLGNPAAPEVQALIDRAQAAIAAAGKPAGILGYGAEPARGYFDRGFGFVAIAGDNWLLARQMDALIAAVKA
ncbi:aldolase/citrate lyase family protein [Pararhodobacter sp. SW119]|uniref:HpcH/HpaI aldolase family protein n=1 Tax=Pararhodobacter sp. SW119 TaxID=2780075 RepID=UPI001ADFCB3C|nr:aldolase/citrate lyase family protein [Pararhodobacter sp. SW119]